MFRLLLKLLLLPPEWLQVHAQGYADLAGQAWAQHLCTLKNRWLLYALSALSLGLGLGLAGVALLLWSALPQIDPGHAWVLVALPLGCWLVSAGLWVWARRLRTRSGLHELRDQIRLDILMLQKARAA